MFYFSGLYINLVCFLALDHRDVSHHDLLATFDYIPQQACNRALYEMINIFIYHTLFIVIIQIDKLYYVHTFTYAIYF